MGHFDSLHARASCLTLRRVEPLLEWLGKSAKLYRSTGGAVVVLNSIDSSEVETRGASWLR